MTKPLKKIAFLDRDGVINLKAPEHQYIITPADFQFTPGIFALLENLAQEGFEFIVITNQRGIARGLLTEDDLTAIHQKMIIGLGARGINLLDIFHCPHQGGECHCRKPEPGMLAAAAAKYPIDLTRSILVSDSLEDVIMGEQFGLSRSFLVKSDEPKLNTYDL